MRYLSVCSGIEAATVAWHPLGWEAAAFSEIEAFPRAVLKHHYPDTPLHGDFTTIGADEYGPIDLLVGGTPCQSFSVAGLRGGLADERGNLALEYLKLADRTRPRWLVWENVPGAFSAVSHDAPDLRPPEINLDGDDGPGDGEEVVVEDRYDSDEDHAFACFLAGLSELGYGWAYRVFDAQYAGVPQRRRRIFVVGHIGDWRRAAAVLFERHSLSGNPPPRREKGQAAPTIPSRSSAGGGLGTDFDCDGGLIAHSLRAEGFDASEDGTGRGTPLVPVTCGALTAKGTDEGMGQAAASGLLVPVCFTAKDYGADASDISPTLRSRSHDGSHANGGVMPAVAFGWQNSPSQGASVSEHTVPTLDKSKTPAVLHSAVRRLTPAECEALQGFPRNYTLIPYRGKQAADGPRYKALGNSMAVPVMRWIGERIAQVDGRRMAETGTGSGRSPTSAVAKPCAQRKAA